MPSTAAGLLQVGLLIVALAAVHRPFGDHLARVYTSTRHLRVERAIYRLARVDPMPSSAGPPTPTGCWASRSS